MLAAPPESQTLQAAMTTVTGMRERISPPVPREPPVAHPGRNQEELSGPVRLGTDGKDTNWKSMGGHIWKRLATESAAPRWRPAKRPPPWNHFLCMVPFCSRWTSTGQAFKFHPLKMFHERHCDASVNEGAVPRQMVWRNRTDHKTGKSPSCAKWPNLRVVWRSCLQCSNCQVREHTM